MPQIDSLLALIPARGGSKGLPGKNIRSLAGHPLLSHSITAAQAIKEVDDVVVTTDDVQIANIAQDYGAEVISRPGELATDSASSADAALHAIDALSKAGRTFSHLMLLQPTSPLRTSAHIYEALEIFKKADNLNSLVSVTIPDQHPYKTLLVNPDGQLQPLIDKPSLEAPRQSLPDIVQPNGAIFLIDCTAFRREKRFFADPVGGYEMSVKDSLDIDTETDFEKAEAILS